MKAKKFAVASAAFAGIVVMGISISPPSIRAQDTEATLSQIGLSIAPVPLNLAGKDQAMVGLGSYFVNSADCNGCHNGGTPPNMGYSADGNPYFAPSKFFLGNPLPVPVKVNPNVYLTGGRAFGAVGTPTGPNKYQGPVVIARNLTPDKNGMPAGGMTLAQFRQAIKTGTDFDHLHPACTDDQIAQITAGATPPPVCIPTSPGNTTNGNVLQIMPWPAVAHLTDRMLDSIYAYLSAIPCIDNSFSPPPAGAPDELRNDCGTASGNLVLPLAGTQPLPRWRR